GHERRRDVRVVAAQRERGDAARDRHLERRNVLGRRDAEHPVARHPEVLAQQLPRAARGHLRVRDAGLHRRAAPLHPHGREDDRQDERRHERRDQELGDRVSGLAREKSAAGRRLRRCAAHGFVTALTTVARRTLCGPKRSVHDATTWTRRFEPTVVTVRVRSKRTPSTVVLLVAAWTFAKLLRRMSSRSWFAT